MIKQCDCAMFEKCDRVDAMVFTRRDAIRNVPFHCDAIPV